MSSAARTPAQQQLESQAEQHASAMECTEHLHKQQGYQRQMQEMATQHAQELADAEATREEEHGQRLRLCGYAHMRCWRRRQQVRNGIPVASRSGRTLHDMTNAASRRSIVADARCAQASATASATTATSQLVRAAASRCILAPKQMVPNNLMEWQRQQVAAVAQASVHDDRQVRLLLPYRVL